MIPIAPSEVAAAALGGKRATRTSAGTITIPPPTPKSALRIPATTPIVASVATPGCASSVNGSRGAGDGEPDAPLVWVPGPALHRAKHDSAPPAGRYPGCRAGRSITFGPGGPKPSLA